MSDDPQTPKLPGNKGQFGENNATEEHKPLEDGPTAPPTNGGRSLHEGSGGEQ